MGKYFSFEGKASRQEYWGVVAIVLIGFFFLSITLGINLVMTSSAQGYGGLGLSFVVFLAGFGILSWVDIATTARRCRDAGISPWWTLTIIPANLILWLGIVLMIVFGVLPPNDSVDSE